MRTAACCDGRTLFRAPSHSRTPLPDGQLPHAPHARIARRANLPHAFALAPSGKSQRCSRPSRLDEEGRFGRSSRYVGRGCDGRGWHVRRTWPCADGEVVWSWRSNAGAKVVKTLSRLTGDGGNQAMVTEESAKEAVKTIAQGRPGIF